MIQIYTASHGIPSVLLRLTNIYGPRAQVKHPHYGVLNWFVRLAVEGKDIPIMGSGTSLRDFIFVDDCIEALLAAGVAPDVDRGEAINIGSDVPHSYLQAAEFLHEICGARTIFIEFSKERAAQEVGDFYSDITKARRLLSWEPKTSLREGLRQHYEWLREHRAHYLF
jgi:UDP-glucose 4-epimerase